MGDISGFFNVLKPSGATSSDVVVRLKRILGQKRVGHLGTLDPGAAGVLPIAVGKATKFFDLLTAKTKKYRAYFTFGKTTDTLDSYGSVIAQKDFVATQDDIVTALKGFVGKIKQVPPKYSALSINGVRAYDMARNGQDFEIKPREVTVYSFDLIDRVDQNTWCFDITCGGGTYIRSLARDLGQALNTVAYMSLLLRLKSGAFLIQDSATIEEITLNPSKYLLNEEFPFCDYQALDVPKQLYKQLSNGVKINDWRNLSNTITDIDYYKVYCEGEFFGIGGFDNQNKLSIKYRIKD